jgi:hypothetical protein
MNKNPRQASSAKAAVERWRRADLARDAQAAGPHEVAKLATELGMPTTTLRRYARVAREFPETVRGRIRGLTFSHLEAAIGVEGALRLLKRAASEHWSVERVKAEARGVASNKTPDGTASKAAIDDAIRYIESRQASRPRCKPHDLQPEALVFELARVLLTMIRAETIRGERVDVA